MHKEFRMGNEAIALGAIAAGVNLISGYPGTPSTEVLETVAKNRTNDCYVEWSLFRSRHTDNAERMTVM